ncbi:MAG: enoyl-CoA hydratase-related protein [Thermoplasmata archaeon]
MAAGPSLVERKSDGDGVEIVILRHPPVNALSTGVLRDLAGVVATLESDPAVRAVVLTGDGQYFSAGADVKEMATMDLAHAPEVVAQGQATFAHLAGLAVPTIAAVNGLAVGGGLELALACDLRVAADAAKFGAPEAKLGLIPAYGGTQRLARLIGVAKAKELIFTGAMIGAAEAARIGLVNRAVPAGQELRAARDLAHTIAQNSPIALKAAKRAIQEGAEGPIAAGLALEAELFRGSVLSGPDLPEGIAAFVEHRPPKFRGG